MKTYAIEFYDGYWQRYGTITARSKPEAFSLVRRELWEKTGRRKWKLRGTVKKKTRTAKNPTIYDGAGKKFGKFSRKAAKIVARAIGGTVGKPKRSKNPLPVGKFVTVRAKRLPNGRIQLFGASGRRNPAYDKNSLAADLGYKFGGQSGWNSAEEAWRFAKEQLKQAGELRRDSRREFMSAWRARRR